MFSCYHDDPVPSVVLEDGDDALGHLLRGRNRAGKRREHGLVGELGTGTFLKGSIVNW
jgi:hypothetical protein